MTSCKDCVYFHPDEDPQSEKGRCCYQPETRRKTKSQWCGVGKTSDGSFIWAKRLHDASR